jgi:lipooligosaccharide transport system permease protein
MSSAPPAPPAPPPPLGPEPLTTREPGAEVATIRSRRGLAAVSTRFVTVWYRDTYVYATNWKTNLVPPLIEPFIYLFAMGLGVGHYIDTIDGVDYLSFVAPGIIATTAILRATFECTYGSYFRMAFQSTYDAIISTPVNAEEVSLGDIFWGATRSFINVVIVVAVLAGFGRVPLLWIPAILVLQFVSGLNFGALSLTVTSKIHQTEYFNFYLSGIIFPAELLTGAFFPVSRLPEILQPIAWIVPLTSMVDLTRAMMLGRLRWASLLELAYILVTTVFFTEVALRAMRRRLIR